MFHHLTQVSTLAHHAVSSYCGGGSLAVDATLGHGADADFLSERFDQVIAFDIQEQAVKAYEARRNPRVRAIVDSHHYMADYVDQPVDCIMFNLGYLPGSDKKNITRAETTWPAILSGLELLRPGGLMTVAIYCGHEGGPQERDQIVEALAGLPKKQFAVLLQRFHNRSEHAPLLALIEKDGS